VGLSSYIPPAYVKKVFLNTFASAIGNFGSFYIYLRKKGASGIVTYNGSQLSLGEAAQNNSNVGGAMGDFVEMVVDSNGIFQYQNTYCSVDIMLTGHQESL